MSYLAWENLVTVILALMTEDAIRLKTETHETIKSASVMLREITAGWVLI